LCYRKINDDDDDIRSNSVEQNRPKTCKVGPPAERVKSLMEREIDFGKSNFSDQSERLRGISADSMTTTPASCQCYYACRSLMRIAASAWLASVCSRVEMDSRLDVERNRFFTISAETKTT